jgi:hypothetical protein
MSTGVSRQLIGNARAVLVRSKVKVPDNARVSDLKQSPLALERPRETRNLGMRQLIAHAEEVS